MILALLLAAAPASPLSSGVGATLREHMQGLASAQVGDWVTFKASGGEGRDSFWRIAIVGEEVDAKGRDAVWMEIELGQHHALKAPLTQLRFLTAKGAGLTRDGVTRGFMAIGADPVREMDGPSLDMYFAAAPKEAPAPKPKVEAAPLPITTATGRETRLVTLAGTLTAVPIEVRLKGTVLKRIWLSRQVPILHLAKVEIPGIAHAVEIREFGTGAKGRMVLPPPGAPMIRVENAADAFPPPPP